MRAHHKETLQVIRSIDALKSAMDKTEEYGADEAMVFIHILGALASTDFNKADAYFHGMDVASIEWRDFFQFQDRPRRVNNVS